MRTLVPQRTHAPELWRGCRLALAFGRHGVRNLATDRYDTEITEVGTSGLTADFWRGDDTSKRLEIPAARLCIPRSVGATPKHVFYLCRFRMQDTGTSQKSIWSIGDTATDSGPYMIATRRSGTFQLLVSGSYRDTGVSLTNTAWHTVSVEMARNDNDFSGSTLDVWVDGVSRLSVVTGTTFEKSTLYLAAGFGDAFSPVDIDVFAALADPLTVVPDNAPTPSWVHAHRRFGLDPHAMFREVEPLWQRPTYFIPAAAGAGAATILPHMMHLAA